MRVLARRGREVKGYLLQLELAHHIRFGPLLSPGCGQLGEEEASPVFDS